MFDIHLVKRYDVETFSIDRVLNKKHLKKKGMKNPCRKCSPKANSRPLFNFGNNKTVCTRMSFVCHSFVLMSSVCHSYVLVYHPYVTHIYSHVTLMYSYVIGMSLVCTRMSSVCHSYVLVCHPCVSGMWFYHVPFKYHLNHLNLIDVPYSRWFI